MRNKPLAKNYRDREVTQIWNAIKAGDSCTIIGIGSAGKSNLLRFLQRPDILKDRLGEDWNRTLIVYVDCNKLLEHSLWGLVELMLHQTMIAVAARDEHSARREHSGDGETVDGGGITGALEPLYEQAIQPNTHPLAIRYLERALHLIRTRLGLHLVYLLYEFDALYERLPARGFSALRALRDEFKYQLSYLIATRHEWTRLRQDAAAVEAFEELVSPHTIWLGPYTEPDARDMLERLAARNGSRLSESNRRAILKETGGHSGLVVAAYRTAVEEPQHLARALRASPRIQDECRRIWFSLPIDEQNVVLRMAADADRNPPTGTVRTSLRNKGLILEVAPAKYALFSKLFGTCILRLKLQAGVRIHLDRTRHSAWVGERYVEHLPPLTFKLLDYLVQHRGELCTRAELTHTLYPDELETDGLGSTDGRLDTIVTRLRKQIEPDPAHPRYVLTERGYGYRLADGPEQH